MSTSFVLKTLAKLTGAELLDEFSTFLSSFSTLFEGLQSRAKQVRNTLTSDQSSFIVVTAPDEATLQEAKSFHTKLSKESIPIGAFIVNRVQCSWATDDELEKQMPNLEQTIAQLHNRKEPTQQDKDLVQQLILNAQNWNRLAFDDKKAINSLKKKLKDIPLITVKLFPHDIHSVEGLNQIRKNLFENPELGE